MAVAATTVWEVRQTGSDTQCSGGFNAARGGTDYTLQNAAQATGTVTSSTTTVTATTAIFTSAMVGNTITDGTTVKEITAFTSTTVVTVDSAPAWTAATIYVGGAFASPGKAVGAMVAGNTVWVKAATYSVTSASTNIASGCVSLTAGSSVTVVCYLLGYNMARWTLSSGPTASDVANKPMLQASGISTATLLSCPNTFTLCDNITTDGASLTAIRGISLTGSSSAIQRVKGINCTNTGIFASGLNTEVYFAEASGCSTQPAIFITDSRSFGLVSHDNTNVTGISILFSSAYPSVEGCLSYSNTGASGIGISCGGRNDVINSTTYNNGSDGVRLLAGNGSVLRNVISYGNGTSGTGYGFNSSGGNTSMVRRFNCATGANATAAANNLGGPNEGAVTLSGNPFNNAGSGDFSLNNTAGAGAACRAAGIPGLFPGGLTTAFPDIGAAQHQDSGGGILKVGMNGGFGS